MSEVGLVMPRRAVVVFWSRAERLGWLRWVLRRGWQHVSAWVECRPGEWVAVDGQAHWLAVAVDRGPSLQEMIEFHRGLPQVSALVVVEGLTEPPRVAVGWRPFTCVEVVARAVGQRTGFACLTPWQLFNKLRKSGHGWYECNPGGRKGARHLGAAGVAGETAGGG